METDFIKCHGNGNDFVLIDETISLIFNTDSERSEFAKVVCDRTGLIGADGILFLGMSRICDYSMRIFNADGSEAEMCGNGIRCVARRAFELSGKDELCIDTMEKGYMVRKEENLTPGVPSYSVLFEEVILDASKVPVKIKDEKLISSLLPRISDRMLFTAVGMPNPHLVTSVSVNNEEIDLLLRNLLTKINENKDIFPQGINISAYREISRGEIYNRTLERGVGLTHSCGTANCSAAIAYSIANPEFYGKWIQIINKGGISRCLVENNRKKISVYLLGNATFLHESRLRYSAASGTVEIISDKKENSEEVIAFEKMLNSVRKKYNN